MKNKLFGLLGSLLLLVTGQILFVGCGSSDNSSTNCASGQIWSGTYNGCLSQSNCPSGMGLYNGTCVYANAGSVGTCATAGYTWNGTSCVYNPYGTNNGNCVPPMVWNGTNCIYGANGAAGQCPAGSTPTNIGCTYQLGGGYTATCVYQTPYFVNGTCLSYP